MRNETQNDERRMQNKTEPSHLPNSLWALRSSF
jgi:hypothetical protein